MFRTKVLQKTPTHEARPGQKSVGKSGFHFCLRSCTQKEGASLTRPRARARAEETYFFTARFAYQTFSQNRCGEGGTPHGNRASLGCPSGLCGFTKGFLQAELERFEAFCFQRLRDHSFDSNFFYIEAMEATLHSKGSTSLIPGITAAAALGFLSALPHAQTRFPFGVPEWLAREIGKKFLYGKCYEKSFQSFRSRFCKPQNSIPTFGHELVVGRVFPKVPLSGSCPQGHVHGFSKLKEVFPHSLPCRVWIFMQQAIYTLHQASNFCWIGAVLELW